MLHADAHWISDRYEWNPAWDPEWHGATETILGQDVTLNGITYKQVLMRNLWKYYDLVQQRDRYLPITPMPGGGGTFRLAAYIREDSLSRKVYVLFPTANTSLNPHCAANQEFIRYDFSLAVGDTVDGCGFGTGFDPDTIRSITIDSLFRHRESIQTFVKSPARRKFDISTSDDLHYHEGIGSQAGLVTDVFENFFFNRLTVYWRDRVQDYSDVIVKRDSQPSVLPAYTPLLNDDAHWIVQWEFGVQDKYETTISGDSVVGGKTYKKLYNQSLTNSIPPFKPTGPKVLCALIREDTANRQVFWIPLISSSGKPFKVPRSCPLGQESLLYDFSTQPLDELPDCDPTTVLQYAKVLQPAGNAVGNANSITGIDSLYFYYYANQDDDHDTRKISDERTHIEGIGSTEGLIEATNYGLNTASIYGLETRLIYYCRENLGGCSQILESVTSNRTGYSSLGWEAGFDPQRNLIRIEFSNDKPELVRLYDLSGKVLSSTQIREQSSVELNVAGLSKGMYVLSAVNGTKVIGRKKVVIQ
ncbi:MAG: T9SS type A sorting domain-containing protein [Bacteroidota bacterium]